MDFELLSFCCETFEEQLRRLQENHFMLYLPRPSRKMRQIAGTHFHFNPELFIQVGGLTDFSFPEEKVRLMAGEALLLPPGLPHNEIARKFKGDFLNLVLRFPPDGICIHAAVEGNKKKPKISSLKHFKTDMGRLIKQYLNDMIDFYHSGGNEESEVPHHSLLCRRPNRESHRDAGRDLTKSREPEVEKIVQGLFQVALASLLLVVKQVKTFSRTTEHPKVSECRKIIINHLHEPSLSVRKLAEHLHCSPDYLSHLFVRETGERIIEYIHQERITLALKHLQNPALNIKEIAWACGFADQNYFTRLFKRFLGETPKAIQKSPRESFPRL